MHLPQPVIPAYFIAAPFPLCRLVSGLSRPMLHDAARTNSCRSAAARAFPANGVAAPCELGTADDTKGTALSGFNLLRWRPPVRLTPAGCRGAVLGHRCSVIAGRTSRERQVAISGRSHPEISLLQYPLRRMRDLLNSQSRHHARAVLADSQHEFWREMPAYYPCSSLLSVTARALHAE
jgi:hypothetical protein